MTTLPVKENVNIEEVLAQMANWQHTHGIEDNVRHEDNLKKFELIGSTLYEMKTNHLRHIQDGNDRVEERLATMQIKQAENSTNMFWIKWLVMGGVSGIGGLLIVIVAALLLK